MKRGTGEKIFDFVNITFLLLFSVTILYPFIYQLNMSLSTPRGALYAMIRLFPMPGEITMKGYELVFTNSSFSISAFNSVWRVLVGTVLSLIFTYMMAYPMSKKYLLGRNVWTAFMVFTMFFSGGLIPSYLLIRDLNLFDTRWVMVIPGLIGAFNVILIRNYLQSLPESLEESARIEGANDIVILYKIIAPLSKPIMATVALWLMVGHWNAWFDVMLYIRKPELQVLQIILRNIVQGYAAGTGGGGEQVFDQMLAQEKSRVTPQSLQAALVMVITFPIICVYPFLQKYFVKGIMMGSLKG